jgi:hypothetical protein
MFLMMRRHWQPSAPGAARTSFFGSHLGPSRNLQTADRPTSQTNPAFEEYHQQTLQRLEREQTDFKSFLEQLRLAKDRAEFDQFMIERSAAKSMS